MAQDPSALLPALRDMFPAMPDDIILAALDANQNDLEGALGTLLEMCSGGDGGGSALTAATGDFAPPQQHLHSQRPPSRTKNKSCPSSEYPSDPEKTRRRVPGGSSNSSASGQAPPCARGQVPSLSSRMTWGQLRSSGHQQLPRRDQPPSSAAHTARKLTSSCHSPVYVFPGAAASARLGEADFPDLLHLGGAGIGTAAAPAAAAARLTPPLARSSSLMTPSYSAGTLQNLMARTGSLSFTSDSGSSRDGGGGASAAAVRPPGGYVSAARRPPPQQSAGAVSCWPRLAGQDDTHGCSDVYDTSAGGQLGGDNGWQEAAVEELCGSHPWAGRELVEAVCMALQYDLAEVVAALDELNAASYQYDGPTDFASTSRLLSNSVSGSSSSEEDETDETVKDSPPSAGAADAYYLAAAAQRGGRGGRAVDAASGRVGCGHLRGEATSPSSGGGGDDAYFRHRSSALKLTQAWRKRMRRASAAFSCGDRAAGRRLVAEAQELRRQAAEAHREAAERIEGEMNQGRQLSQWELDLHGLHAQEAVEALAKRIAALEASAPSPAPGAAAASPLAAAGVAAAGFAAPTTSSRTLLGPRRVLRVIVGKGLHSSGGEASLPRVVRNFLLERGYRFTPLAGVIEVQLRRHYAVVGQGAAAASGAAAAAAAPPARLGSGHRLRPR